MDHYRYARDARHWQARAEELRTLSETFSDETRHIMLRIAADYERLASLVDVPRAYNKLLGRLAMGPNGDI